LLEYRCPPVVRIGKRLLVEVLETLLQRSNDVINLVVAEAR